MPEEKPKRGPRINIQLDDAIAQGMYCNLVLLNHSQNEFVFDFAFAAPGATAAKVRTRVILSPRHAKRFLAAVQHNVTRYEKRFGTLEVKPPVEGEPVMN